MTKSKEIAFNFDEMKKTQEIGEACGIKKDVIEIIAMAVVSDIENNEINGSQTAKDEKRKQEILSIEDDVKRQQEIAKNIDLFKGGH